MAIVYISAAFSAENPRCSEIYVGNQNTTVVRTIPVTTEIIVNLIISRFKSIEIPLVLPLGDEYLLYWINPFFS